MIDPQALYLIETKMEGLVIKLDKVMLSALKYIDENQSTSCEHCNQAS